MIRKVLHMSRLATVSLVTVLMLSACGRTVDGEFGGRDGVTIRLTSNGNWVRSDGMAGTYRVDNDVILLSGFPGGASIAAKLNGDEFVIIDRDLITGQPIQRVFTKLSGGGSGKLGAARKWEKISTQRESSMNLVSENYLDKGSIQQFGDVRLAEVMSDFFPLDKSKPLPTAGASRLSLQAVKCDKKEWTTGPIVDYSDHMGSGTVVQNDKYVKPTAATAIALKEKGWFNPMPSDERSAWHRAIFDAICAVKI